MANVSLLLLLTVTDTAAVFLFWRVSAVAARAALTGGSTEIVYGKATTHTGDTLLLYTVRQDCEATRPLVDGKSGKVVQKEKERKKRDGSCPD